MRRGAQTFARRQALRASRGHSAFFPSAAAAGYEVTDIRDNSVWYYFNVCGAAATPVTDGPTNREQ